MFRYFHFDLLSDSLAIKRPSCIEQWVNSILYCVFIINNFQIVQLSFLLILNRFKSLRYTPKSSDVYADFYTRVFSFLDKYHLDRSLSIPWFYSKMHMLDKIVLINYKNNKPPNWEGFGYNFQSKFNITNGSA